MNKRQRIVIIGAIDLMLLIKLALPPFQPWEGSEEHQAFLGIFDAGSLVALLGAVAAIAVVLMVVFREKK